MLVHFFVMALTITPSIATMTPKNYAPRTWQVGGGGHSEQTHRALRERRLALQSEEVGVVNGLARVVVATDTKTLPDGMSLLLSLEHQRNNASSSTSSAAAAATRGVATRKQDRPSHGKTIFISFFVYNILGLNM